jgi:hypothetical protein
VTLPPGRKEERIEQLRPFLDPEAKFSYHDTQVLTGRLNHVTYIMPQLRCYLRELYKWQMEWSNTSPLHPIPKEARLDLKKWLWSLEKYHSTTLIPDPDPTDVGWYGNTLTSYGLGVLIGKYWAKCELKDRYIRNAPIAWLETLAVRVGLMMLERLGISKGKNYLVRTDNSTMLAAIQQRKSKDNGVNAKWKVIQEILIAAQIDLYPLRVKSVENKADGLSQGYRDGHRMEHRIPVVLPPDLATFVIQPQ